MSKNIVTAFSSVDRYKEINPKCVAVLTAEGYGDLLVGDIFVSDDGRYGPLYFRIVKIEYNEKRYREHDKKGYNMDENLFVDIQIDECNHYDGSVWEEGG